MFVGAGFNTSANTTAFNAYDYGDSVFQTHRHAYIKKRRCKAPSHKNTNIIWLLFYNMHIHLRERYIDTLLCKCLVNFLIHAEKDIPILS